MMLLDERFMFTIWWALKTFNFLFLVGEHVACLVELEKLSVNGTTIVLVFGTFLYPLQTEIN
jgi:hypothetical protein